MAVHGIASIFTILGGATFVIVAIRPLWQVPAGSIDGVSLTSDGEPASPGEASAEL